MRGTNRLRAVVLASLTSVALVGCGGPPVATGENSAALGTAFANDQPAYDFFVAKGLTSFQAAGIVGNLDQESGVDPTIAQYGGGPGRGIAQWSVGGRWDTSSMDNVVWYAGVKGEGAKTLNLQLEFIWYELTTYGYGFSALKASTNVTDATVAFMDDYEICGACAQTQRVSYAQSVLAAYGATPDYAATFVSQTWPYASQPPFTVQCGESVAANIVLKNTGSKAWDSSTKLGTTMPRDRSSMFAGSDWLAPNRPAGISGSVAPGANGTFAFSFHGPTGAQCVPGTYTEYFGVVQEGSAWFSDSGQGGPPDNQIEALIKLEPGPAMAEDGGQVQSPDDGGTSMQPGSDGGSLQPTDDGGVPNGPGSGGPGSGSGSGSGSGAGSVGGSTGPGCQMGGSSTGDGLLFVLAALWLLLGTRRRASA